MGRQIAVGLMIAAFVAAVVWAMPKQKPLPTFQYAPPVPRTQEELNQLMNGHAVPGKAK